MSVYCANDWVQLLELLNKVWDLGLVLLPSYSGDAYKKRGQVRLLCEKRDFTLRFPKSARWIKEQQVVRHFRGLFDAHKQPSAC